ncbi:MAG: GNAT family N-acetyltransferase [Candidatus Heimdallarchaeota archaeon]|nr:GNAT family N-acetyltransferase [Candidatus Heimdallarchaeota archaeon]
MAERIRTYEKKDYEQVIELWEKTDLTITLSDQRDELQKTADRNPDSFFILENEGIIIGTVIAAWDGRRGYIHHLAVHPEYQRRGYGKQLMAYSMDYFNKNGAVKVHLFVENRNAAVIEFYKSMGWVVRDELTMMTATLRK